MAWALPIGLACDSYRGRPAIVPVRAGAAEQFRGDAVASAGRIALGAWAVHAGFGWEASDGEGE